MKRKLSILAVLACAFGIGVSAIGQPIVSHYMRIVAPPAPGTAGYPYGADNGNDAWRANGPTTVQCASLAGLVANTPVNVIPASSGKKIVVFGYNISSNVAGSTVQFQDQTGTPIVYTGKYTFPANGFINVPVTKYPVIITAAGAALDIAIAGSSDVVGGTITYAYE